jgi:hypothetical protein
LGACLKGLLAQNYPDYQLHIVIDSAEDPAQEAVAHVLAGAGPHAVRVHVETRRILGEACGAKMSAQRQVLMALDDAVTVVAFIDADCSPSPHWLRALVAPVADVRVGATTGFRWSAPLDTGWGTLVRHVFHGLIFRSTFLSHPMGRFPSYSPKRARAHRAPRPLDPLPMRRHEHLWPASVRRVSACFCPGSDNRCSLSQVLTDTPASTGTRSLARWRRARRSRAGGDCHAVP